MSIFVPNIRLLEETNGYFSTKTLKPIGKNIIELPHSVTKDLVACRNTITGVFR